MYRFEHTEFLWLLTIIPIVVIIAVGHRLWRKRALKRLGDWPLIQNLLPNYAPKMKIVKTVLFVFGLFFLVVGTANFQFGTKQEEVKSKGIDLVIALDISNSMLCEDIMPNRLESSKRAIEQLIGKLHNDRLGIIVFAGDAMVQLPITTDYAAAKLFLRNISTDVIAKQGTAIGTALELAAESFDLEAPTQKAIVVITDGENHEDVALDFANEIAKKGVIIHTIGMGAPNGGPIPVYKGKKQVGFRKDRSGNTVISKLDENMLKKLAEAGEGVYVRASASSSGLSFILQEIEAMEKTEFDSKVIRNYKSRFQLFLVIALAFLLLREILPNNKKSIFSKELFKED